MLLDVIARRLYINVISTSTHASSVKMMANASPKNHGQGHGFLNALAACPTIPKHPYNKGRELWHRQQTNSTKANEYKSEWTLLTDIDNQTFTRDFLTEDLDQDEEEADLQKCLNLSSFDAKSQPPPHQNARPSPARKRRTYLQRNLP